MDSAAISFLDILGFKGIWQSRKSEEVLQLLNGVKKKVDEIYQQPPPESGWPETDPPEITVLSDTIVIVMKSDEPHCLFLLANIIYGLYAYFMNANLFLRGAVSWGKYLQSGSTFIGPAIDDVASWYESTDWIGTVLTPKTSYLMDTFTTIEMGIAGYQVKPYIKYQVPDKDGNTHHLYSVNWPAYLQASYKHLPKKEDEIEAQKLMFKIFSKQPAFNGSVLKKYENTMQFLEYSIKDFKQRNR
jgi:hypothetical protein